MNLKNKKRVGRHQTRSIPTQAYSENLLIEKAKLKDLLSLCEMGLVILTYHDFYKSLNSR